MYQALFHVNYPYYFQQRDLNKDNQTFPDLQRFLKLGISNVVHGWVEDVYLRRILYILNFSQVIVKAFEWIFSHFRKANVNISFNYSSKCLYHFIKLSFKDQMIPVVINWLILWAVFWKFFSPFFQPWGPLKLRGTSKPSFTSMIIVETTVSVETAFHANWLVTKSHYFHILPVSLR